MPPTKSEVLRNLREIPGVGKSIAEDLWQLNIRSVNGLRKKNPERMYEQMCKIQKTRIDPCLLYVFRCAVYYASTKNPNPELLQWWKWKDR